MSLPNLNSLYWQDPIDMTILQKAYRPVDDGLDELSECEVTEYIMNNYKSFAMEYPSYFHPGDRVMDRCSGRLATVMPDDEEGMKELVTLHPPVRYDDDPSFVSRSGHKTKFIKVVDEKSLPPLRSKPVRPVDDGLDPSVDEAKDIDGYWSLYTTALAAKKMSPTKTIHTHELGTPKVTYYMPSNYEKARHGTTPGRASSSRTADGSRSGRFSS